MSNQDNIGKLDFDAYDAMMKKRIVDQMVNRIGLAVPETYARLAAQDIYSAIVGGGVDGLQVSDHVMLKEPT